MWSVNQVSARLFGRQEEDDVGEILDILWDYATIILFYYNQNFRVIMNSIIKFCNPADINSQTWRRRLSWYVVSVEAGFTIHKN